MTVSVYRAFDCNDRLLYVGCSNNVTARMSQHSKTSAWHLFHSRIEVVDYPTQDEATAAETEAIYTEHPRWNVHGRSEDHPDGPSRRDLSTHLDYERDLAKRHRNLVDEEARLVRQIRRSRMALAGANAEVAAVLAGLDVDLDVA